MKKIKTFNKLLSSLTLLSPLSGIGFNSQYQTTQKVITENSYWMNNYVTLNAEPVQMGDITVTVEGTVITGYVEGKGTLQVSSKITEIANNAFKNNENITSLDFSQATSLTTIGESAFGDCGNLTGDLVIPPSMTSIASYAFYNDSKIHHLDLSNATSLTTIGNASFSGNKNLTGDLMIPSSVTSIGFSVFENSTINSLYFFSKNPPSFGNTWKPTVTGKVYVPSEQAKQAYLSQSNFGFNEEQVEIVGISGKISINIEEKSIGSEKYIVTEEFSPTKWEIVMSEGEKPNWLSIDNNGLLSWTEKSSPGIYKFKIKANNLSQTSIESAPITFIVNRLPKPNTPNVPLILGLVFGLGIPIILAIGFGIWYLFKKKKTIVKI